MGREQFFAGYLGNDVESSEEALDAIRVRLLGSGHGVSTSPWRLGALDFCVFDGSVGVDVRPYRTHKEVPGLSLGLCLSGEITVTQGGNRAELSAGDMTCYSMRSPFHISAPGPHRYLITQVPLFRIGLETVALTAIQAVRISGSVSASILASTLTMLAARHEELTPTVQLHYADAICSMIQAAVSDTRSGELNTRHLTLFNRMARWIEDRIRTNEVTCEAVADAHHLSPRHVRAIFAQNGVSVSSFVRERRFELVRRDLVNPDLAEVSISRLAQRHGFYDASTFSRGFRQQYGQSPSSYRVKNTRLLNH